MNIILLSGGSGKRLWPLSNEIRSKQFIKILKRNDNTYESMVERVYRQIRSVDNEANILIATSESQVPMIKNQLGDNINISIEPCRRDTFPAIVLACLYLKYVKSINENETVVVSPVDPYVDDVFFDSLKNLDNKMKKSKNNIGLIGITPTYASEKYGYIVINKSKGDLHVEKFVEKPKEQEAKRLIFNGALWNGGAFCFKLKYVINKAHEILDFKDYDDFYKKYDTFPKISFDYAVVEKENNIDVIKYDGEWKDIGTWNTLSEVMNDKTLGNVIMDKTCENVNVINELNIPIITMGLKDAIVAASHDGIFVSDKYESSFNKPLVEQIDNRPMYEERVWGDFKILDINSNGIIKSLTKQLFIKAGCRISYQNHKHRDEVWIIIDGKGTFILDDVKKDVSIGDVLVIKKGQKHSLIGITNLKFIEVQIGEELSENDIERFV